MRWAEGAADRRPVAPSVGRKGNGTTLLLVTSRGGAEVDANVPLRRRTVEGSRSRGSESTKRSFDARRHPFSSLLSLAFLAAHPFREARHSAVPSQGTHIIPLPTLTPAQPHSQPLAASRRTSNSPPPFTRSSPLPHASRRLPAGFARQWVDVCCVCERKRDEMGGQHCVSREKSRQRRVLSPLCLVLFDPPSVADF